MTLNNVHVHVIYYVTYTWRCFTMVHSVFLKLTVLSLVLLNNNCFFGRNVQYLRYYIQSHVHVHVDTCTCVR